MIDMILIIILAAVILSAGYYVYRAKKSGRKCIGCPDSCSCQPAKKSKGCGCCHDTAHK